MSKAVFDKRPEESGNQWVVRLHLDPWFEGSSSAELADFTGLRIELVEAALRRWASSSTVVRIHQHATAIAEAIGWQGTPDALVHLALERYAQRFDKRAREKAKGAVPLDKAIDWFLAQHMTASEVSD